MFRRSSPPQFKKKDPNTHPSLTPKPQHTTSIMRFSSTLTSISLLAAFLPQIAATTCSSLGINSSSKCAARCGYSNYSSSFTNGAGSCTCTGSGYSSYSCTADSAPTPPSPSPPSPTAATTCSSLGINSNSKCAARCGGSNYSGSFSNGAGSCTCFGSGYSSYSCIKDSAPTPTPPSPSGGDIYWDNKVYLTNSFEVYSDVNCYHRATLR